MTKKRQPPPPQNPAPSPQPPPTKQKSTTYCRLGVWDRDLDFVLDLDRLALLLLLLLLLSFLMLGGGEGKERITFLRYSLLPWSSSKVVHCTSVEETVFTEVFSSSGRDFYLPIVRALWNLLPLLWLFFNGFGIHRYWSLLFSFYFSRGS